MNVRRLRMLWILAIPLLVSVCVSAQIPLEQYEDALSSIPVSNPAVILYRDRFVRAAKRRRGPSPLSLHAVL